MLSARDRSLAREKLLYEQILAQAADHAAALARSAAALARIDALAGLAHHARAHGWVAPELTEETCLDIAAGRHPVVEHSIEPFTPNDCRMDEEHRMLLITGPNMGGKSTYMRQVALIALLARAGSYVPAARAKIGPVDRIFTRIGAADDLAGGRSTFMMEMMEAGVILGAATPRSLVLMDEIGRGTSTYDGLALAWAIAHRLLTTNRALALFATHYFEMTRLPEKNPRCGQHSPSGSRHGRWRGLPARSAPRPGQPKLRPARGPARRHPAGGDPPCPQGIGRSGGPQPGGIPTGALRAADRGRSRAATRTRRCAPPCRRWSPTASARARRWN